MSDLIERVRAGGLLAPGRPVLVLLSGGRDSVCLLDLAVRIAGVAQVTALHCNYGLRDAADADAAFCAALCERLGVRLHVRRPERGAGNLQAWARDARYAAARELAAGDIAAGHTASDQAETVLYRLAASPGRRALLGMRERDGQLVRPLLGVTRAETAAHCRARGLDWVEDASNADPAFARGRVRHSLLPALRSIHPAAEANVLRTLALLRDEADVLDEVVGAALAAAGDPPRRRRAARAPARAAAARGPAARGRRPGDRAPHGGDPGAARGRRARRRRRPARGDPRRRAAVRREHGTRGAAAS